MAKYPDFEDSWLQCIKYSTFSYDLSTEVIKQTRDLYLSSFKKVSTWSEYLSQDWTWFERAYGDLNSYLQAEWSITRKQKDAMKIYEEQNKNQSNNNHQEPKNRKQQKNPKKRTREEFKDDKHIKKDAPPKKKQKTDTITLYINNLPWKKEDQTHFEVDEIEESLKTIFTPCGQIQNIRVPKNEKNRLAGFAFIDFNSSDCGK